MNRYFVDWPLARARQLARSMACAGARLGERAHGTILDNGLHSLGTGRRPVSVALRADAAALIDDIGKDKRFTVVPQSRRLFEQGLDLYRSRADKEWSLTDCIFFVVMTEHGLTDALSSDHHFEQAGFRALLRLSPPTVNGP
jgi:hypothetical protein